MAKKDPTYEEQVEELDEILERIDQSETPIDELAKDVKRGTVLIRALNEKLKAVESEVKDAFESLRQEESAEEDEG